MYVTMQCYWGEPHLALLLDVCVCVCRLSVTYVVGVRYAYVQTRMRWPAQTCINQSPLYSFILECPKVHILQSIESSIESYE